jgi:hypothetical protein
MVIIYRHHLLFRHQEYGYMPESRVVIFCRILTMDAANLLSLVEHLEDNVDELEENLEPLLSAALTTTTQKLPLLDKAKLYVLIVYSIESLLFCETDPLPTTQALIAHSLSTTQWSQGERSPSL